MRCFSNNGRFPYKTNDGSSVLNDEFSAGAIPRMGTYIFMERICDAFTNPALAAKSSKI